MVDKPYDSDYYCQLEGKVGLEGELFDMISQRLKQLRLARGLSLEGLAAEIGGIVTKQALSKYEQGKALPSAVVLNKLAAALGVKAAHLWSEPSTNVRFIAYRKDSGLPKSEQARVESLVRQALEERIRLQELIQPTNHPELPVQELPIESVESAEQAAEELRERWKLGLDPVSSVIGVLENHFVHVLEIDAKEKFDGISAIACEDEEHVVAAAVVTRRVAAGERQRLNLTHELGHLVLMIPENVDEEKAAFRFGAAFLAPAEVVYREIGRRRASIRADELLLLKRRFGLSVQAVLFRIRDLGIITESYFRRWWVEINRRGWRKQEPNELPPEQPQWLRQNMLRALAEGLITQDDAQAMLGEAVEMGPPLSLAQRRAFMKLPLEERRRMLAEQAKRLAPHYEKDSEWRDLQVGDFIEY